MESTLDIILQGGEFILKDCSDIFIPESFSEDRKEMARVANGFVKSEIHKHIEKIENQEGDIVPRALEKAGELGLLGMSIPEKYGGVGLGMNDSLLIADMFGSAGSFSTTYGAHTGIGVLPIMYYGTESQREKYLPRLVSGELKSCYCLTEPNAGSDANAGKAKAILSSDGKHYIINGQKIWISNSGFADVFIVFAKIDDDKNLSAFIVDKKFGGIELGEEEKKLGIKGSSTRQVFFKNCRVPVENLLSERGKGFKIAVNVLNVGRLKLGAGVLGSCRHVLNISYQYAKDRHQFGAPIFSFGAIKEKLAIMASKIFTTESMCYRVGHDIDQFLATLDKSKEGNNPPYLKAIERFAIESSIAKVYGSEVLEYITDEGVQIHGGMGYSAELPMERCYRDARIARIYEGTNEINRMLSVGMLFRKALKGELALESSVKEAVEELKSMTPSLSSSTGFLAEEKSILKGFKKAFLLVGGKSIKTYESDIDKEQEILMRLSDILIQIYASESALLRAEKIYDKQGEKASYKIQLAQICLYEASNIIYTSVKEVLDSLPKDDEKNMIQIGIKRFVRPYRVNITKLRRDVADAYVPTEYPF